MVEMRCKQGPAFLLEKQQMWILLKEVNITGFPNLATLTGHPQLHLEIKQTTQGLVGKKDGLEGLTDPLTIGHRL